MKAKIDKSMASIQEPQSKKGQIGDCFRAATLKCHVDREKKNCFLTAEVKEENIFTDS